MGTIRLLLAISVVIQHSSPLFGIKLWGGEMAVEMFFIISGFYMALILNEKYKTPEYNVTFYKNRILKIFPIYLITLLITLLITSIFFIISYSLIQKGAAIEYFIKNFDTLGWASLYIFITNIIILGQDLLLFLGIDNGSIVYAKSFSDTELPMFNFLIIPQSWTLSLELTFYLIAPFILRKNLKLLFLIFFTSLSLKAYLFILGYSFDPWKYRFFFSELFLFIFGAILYKLYHSYQNKFLTILENKIIYKFLYTIFLSLGLFASSLYGYISLAVVPIAYISFIVLLPFAFHNTKYNKFDRAIGELSYPVYIVHVFVIYFTSRLFENSMEPLVTIIVSILISIILNKYIQEKVEKIRVKNIKGTK